jgi:hypothetical protein
MDVLKRDIGEGEDAGCGLLLAVACSLVKRGGGREEEGTESIKFDLRTVFLPILPRQFKGVQRIHRSLDTPLPVMPQSGKGGQEDTRGGQEGRVPEFQMISPELADESMVHRLPGEPKICIVLSQR